MGRWSFSPHQRAERQPDLEPLTRLTVAEIMSASPDTIDADLPLDHVVTTMMGQNRRWAPVVDDGGYVGLVAVTDIATIPTAQWPTMTARHIARTDIEPATLHEHVATVAARLRTSHSGAVAVTDTNRVVGVVTLRDLNNVEVLLDRLTDDTGGS